MPGGASFCAACRAMRLNEARRRLPAIPRTLSVAACAITASSEPVLPSSTKFRREERRRWKMWTVEDRERYKDDGRRYPSDLTDAEWELVRSLFETYPTLTRDIRAMVDGCLYLGAEGCRWRSLPEDF